MWIPANDYSIVVCYCPPWATREKVMTDTEALLIIIISVVFIAACVVLAFFYFLNIERFFKWWAKKDAEMKRKFEEELRKEKNRGEKVQQ